MSRLFTKTSKEAPHDAESANAKLLVQGGFVHQEMAGVYTWLPLGLSVLRKVQEIIRQEMNALGAQEILMPSLQPKEPWVTTGRWDNMDVLFKIKSQTKKEYALGPTHEEIVTPLLRHFVTSYKDLPVAVYQIQSKFRDELRAKSGILRGREFGMKDLYSFHLTQEDFEEYYAKAMEAYLRIFKRCGLNAKMTEASGGDFTKKFSHEFHLVTPAGEDTLLCCPSCTFAQNLEIATKEKGDDCPQCGAILEINKGIEIGNIFDLGQKFTEAFDFKIKSPEGKEQPLYMGCYGIGTTRVVGAIVEASNDERGIIWPKSVAPMPVHIVTLSSKDETVQSKIIETAESLLEDLRKEGIDALWDDRASSAGEKLADADLIGLPLRILISEKTLKENSVEWKLRASKEVQLVNIEDVFEEIVSFVKNS
jgi:prolyl-tRNA synthetase